MGMFLGALDNPIMQEEMKGREQLIYTAKQMGRRSINSAKAFAVMGLVFSATECIVEKDTINSLSEKSKINTERAKAQKTFHTTSRMGYSGLQKKMVVTDNASNYKAAGKILMERRPTLFWTPCAAHCIDLMLEDIGKMQQNKSVIRKARMITNFIYRHTRLLDAVRVTIGGDLVRHSVTRFATSFLTLQSLLKHEEKLKLFFVSPSWNTANLAKTEAGKQIVEIILSSVFWNGVRDCLKGGKPLIAVLRLVDGDERPAMPEVYVAMEEAKQKIKEHFDNKERLYKKIIEIIENRWTNQMEQKLYRAALFLNPGKYFEYEENHMDDAWKFQDAFNDVIARLVPDQELQDKIAEQGTNYKASRNSFGKPMAIRQLDASQIQPHLGLGVAVYRWMNCIADIDPKKETVGTASGPKAACAGCAGFAAFSVLIEKFFDRHD
ncbi:Mitochondrial import inner membrane translocase subunit TIM22-1 [Platanthera zijinensis]|uniref:Mitochondrial import inner membrane translocase subunit TIM22-1 n=1 Tax=Platanthera zijinensis TaxID=2320716 RepID=A0AAP0BQE8_9ASPA